MQKGNKKLQRVVLSNDTAQNSSVKRWRPLNQNCLYVQWRPEVGVSVVGIYLFIHSYQINDALENTK